MHTKNSKVEQEEYRAEDSDSSYKEIIGQKEKATDIKKM